MDTNRPGILLFYWRLMREASWFTIEGYGLVATLFAIFLTLVALFNKQLAELLAPYLMTTWGGISPWWALLLVVVIVLGRVANENYKQTTKIQQKLAEAQKRLDERADRKQIRDTLAGFWQEANHLGHSLSVSTCRDWDERVVAYLCKLGMEYAVLFQDANVPRVRNPQRPLYDQNAELWWKLQARITRLQEVIGKFSDPG